MNTPYKKKAKRHYSLFPKPLAKGLISPVSTALKKRGFDHEAIMHYWPQIVGAELATHSCPVKLKHNKNDAHSQLLVKVHPAYSLILSHQSEQILVKLTQYLGYRPAARITLIQ